jgi:hypothetical protein
LLLRLQAREKLLAKAEQAGAFLGIDSIIGKNLLLTLREDRMLR